MKRLGKLLIALVGSASIAAGVAAAASSPSVSTGPVSKVKQTSAVLNGTVNANGAATTYYFQWGLTKSYGVTGHPHSAGNGTGPVAVKANPHHLIPGTRYHYRLVAINRFGATLGRDRTFRTAGHPPPGTSTGPASGVGSTFATLTGVVNPHGQTTTWTFAYGPSTAYGSLTTGGTVAAGGKPVTVASSISGLAPGTIFHYQLIARHGTTIVSFGGDRIFMTHPAKPQKPLLRARTRPRRARHSPFVFTVSGRLIGPASIPAEFACSGDVKIRFFRGRRRVAVILVAVQPNCTFSGQVAFAHRPARNKHRPVRLQVRVHYLGNGYLAPTARREHVIAG